MNLRDAAQQALEALELGYDSAKSEADQYHAAMAGYKPQRHAQMDADVQQIAKAITALKAALAEPVQEPVAWMWEETAPRSSTGIGGIDRKLLFCRPADEPWKRNITPLYTAPPQRKPLTDEEIHDCWQQKHRDKVTERRLITRAIERAHGIVPSDCPDSHQPGCDRCRSPLWCGDKCSVCGAVYANK